MVIARGNVAVVTGGASGIGLAVAEQLIARGMRVALADIDDAKLRAVTARLTEGGADVLAHACDTSSAKSMGDFADAVLTRFGAAHLLFNNAGIAGVGDAWGGTLDLWDRVIGVNLYGVVHGIRAFLPIMEQQGIGHIVNTASMAGLTPVPGLAPYAATKHAVVGFVRSLAPGLLAKGISFNAVLPGAVDTNILGDGFADKARAMGISMIPVSSSCGTPGRRTSLSTRVKRNWPS